MTTLLVLTDATCAECGTPARLHDGHGGAWCSPECETRTQARAARTPRPRPRLPEPALPTREPLRSPLTGAWTYPATDRSTP